MLQRSLRVLMSGASASMLLSNVLHGQEAAPRARPNVLVIMTDDLNDSVEGMGGHPQAHTPNIARLMERGVQFTNAQCNAPICGPSRASLWTGVYPHHSGYYGYRQQENHWRRFPVLRNAVTMMEHFRAHGYAVAGTGKVFHNGHEDNTVWSRQGAISGSGIRPDFGPWPWDGTTMRYGRPAGVVHPAAPAPFNRSHFGGFAPLSDIPVIPPDAENGITGFEGWMLWGRPYRYRSDEDRDPMPDEMNVAWAAERLARPQDNPFFMVVGMNRPHAPFYVPQKYYDLFPLEDLQLPPYKADDLLDCAPPLWQDPETGERTWRARQLPRVLEAGGEELWRRWLQGYLASAAFVDARIGEVLDALWEGPNGANTIVIVTSDHGYHLGEKDHLGKTTAWEEVTRVPLVILAPGVSQPGQRAEHPVALIDLYPTLLDLCELPGLPQEAQSLGGYSLRPFLEDPSTTVWDGPPAALSALHGPVSLRPNEPGRLEDQHFSLRSQGFRYVRCHDGSEEFYEHGADPHHWTNLVARPQSLQQPRIAEALNWHRQQMDAMLGRGMKEQ